MNPFIADFYALQRLILARLADKIPGVRVLPAWDLDWANQQVQLAPVVFLMYGNHGPGVSGHGDETVRQVWMTVAVTKYTAQATLASGQPVLTESGGLPSTVMAALRRWTPDAAHCDPLQVIAAPAPVFANGFLFTSIGWAANINFIDD